MSDDDTGDKSEEASEKKLKKAKGKGDVPISKEAGHLMGYGALFILAAWLVPNYAIDGATALGSMFSLAARVEIGTGEIGISDLASWIYDPVYQVASFTMLALIVFFVASLISGIMQGPFVVAVDRITPKGSKLSPIKGLKKIFGADNFVEFVKNFIKLIMVGTICLWVAYMTVSGMMPGVVMSPEWIPQLIADRTSAMLAWVVLSMIPIVIFDIIWKRFSHNKKQRMSMKDIKDEHKESEGDPLIKGKRMQIARQMSRRQARTLVPQATLIITNPTHYAIALKYERGVDVAPICLIKGVDGAAAHIRRIAHENNIPVIESRALARLLYATADEDRPIPEAQWPAVAQLVGFVYDIRMKIRRKPPEGASIRLPEHEES